MRADIGGGGYAPSDKRPGDWYLLGEDSDPLPADEYTIAHEAQHYSDTAKMIRDQVDRLRKIANASEDGSLEGDYVEGLVKSANDLADHLEQTEGRFDTVATQLGRWAPVLAHGRTMSAKYLADAKDAHTRVGNNAPPTTPVDPKDDAAVTADGHRATRYADATGDLSTAQSNYDDLMHNPHDGVRTIAGQVAQAIKDASHDKLKDSFWDGFRKWIHDHADLLRFIADVLTWIATAIVVAVLIVGTGGLGLAMLLTAGALLIHTMLAANGDGSWADVALDAFALVTMGTGKLASSGAKLALGAREGVAAFSETVADARAAFAGADGLFGKAATWFKESNVVVRNVKGLLAGKNAFTETVAGLTEKVGFKESMRLLAHPSEWSVTRAFTEGGIKGLGNLLNFGDKNAADIDAAINSALGKYGPGALLNSGHDLMNVARVAFPVGFGTDITFKGMNPAFPRFWDDGEPIIPSHGPWSEWAEEHTTSHGGYW